MRRAIARLALVLALETIGCTYAGGLAYQPSQMPISPPVRGHPAFSVGPIEDRRDKRPNELGAVRGGDGNALKRLTTDKSVADLVRTAFEEALRARGFLADPGKASIVLRVSVTKLDCDALLFREAHTHLDIEAIDVRSGRVSWTNTYAADLGEPGFWTSGIFANVDQLRALAEQSLTQAVNKAIDDANTRFLASQTELLAVPAPAIDLDLCVQKCQEHTDRSKEECFDRCAGIPPR